MGRILLIEDDIKIREVIQEYFEAVSENEHEFIIAEDGDKGLDIALNAEYDLILLDIMLPGNDGFTICKEVRKNSMVPIIFLTARNMENDCLNGYAIGGDDYITKPFSIAELHAKVSAILRRVSNNVSVSNLTTIESNLIYEKDITKDDYSQEVIVIGNTKLNTLQNRVYVNNEIINLPYKEYEILKYFMSNKGVMISRDMILNKVWGDNFEVFDRVVDNHIKKLRKMLKGSDICIETVHKKGYRLK